MYSVHIHAQTLSAGAGVSRHLHSSTVMIIKSTSSVSIDVYTVQRVTSKSSQQSRLFLCLSFYLIPCTFLCVFKQTIHSTHSQICNCIVHLAHRAYAPRSFNGKLLKITTVAIGFVVRCRHRHHHRCYCYTLLSTFAASTNRTESSHWLQLALCSISQFVLLAPPKLTWFACFEKMQISISIDSKIAFSFFNFSLLLLYLCNNNRFVTSRPSMFLPCSKA